MHATNRTRSSYRQHVLRGSGHSKVQCLQSVARISNPNCGWGDTYTAPSSPFNRVRCLCVLSWLGDDIGDSFGDGTVSSSSLILLALSSPPLLSAETGRCDFSMATKNSLSHLVQL
jgi:hypothetical protein